MKPIALLFNGVWSQYIFAKAPKYRDFYRLVYTYQLSSETLDGCASLVIPFQSNHHEISRRQAVIERFLGEGKTVVCFGNAHRDWIGAQWEDRPVNNWWWKETPDQPPVAETDFEHPLFAGLTPRQACWHTHGIYTRLPEGTQVLQRNGQGEVVTWQTRERGGLLLASTLDPIVEHGVQQIGHLDHFCDNLTAWLSGTRPSPEKLSIAPDGLKPTASSHVQAFNPSPWPNRPKIL